MMRRGSGLTWVILLLAVVLGRCGGESSFGSPPAQSDASGGADASGVCVAGETQACVGPGACRGGQRCREDGRGWEPCDCGSGSAGAGGAESTGGSGGASGMAPGGSSGMASGGNSGTVGSDGSAAFGGTGGTGGSNADACVVARVQPETPPIDMYIMLDQSTSLTKTLPNSQNLWQALSAGIQSFVGSPQAAGVGVGIQYFGIGTGTPACNIDQYATPEVAISTLPGVGSAIVASLANHGPRSFTPTGPALAGALDYATRWAAQHPRRTVVVLITDGYPTECQPQSMSEIAQLASAAQSGSPKVFTYVIGVGSLANLDIVAQAGGTRRAWILSDSSANLAAETSSALLEIAADRLAGCAFQIPPPPTPTSFDPNLVNVEFTPASGAPRMLVRVASSAACAAVNDAWYYDNPAAPTRIVVCPTTCAAFAPGRLEVLYGCPSITG